MALQSKLTMITVKFSVVELSHDFEDLKREADFYLSPLVFFGAPEANRKYRDIFSGWPPPDILSLSKITLAKA